MPFWYILFKDVLGSVVRYPVAVIMTAFTAIMYSRFYRLCLVFVRTLKKLDNIIEQIVIFLEFNVDKCTYCNWTNLFLSLAFVLVFLYPVYVVFKAAYQSLNRIASNLKMDPKESIGITPEKMLPGSNLEQHAKMPKFQVEIWIDVDGLWVFQGYGFRVGDNLYTAGHVVEGAIKFKLVNFEGKSSVVDTLNLFRETPYDFVVGHLCVNDWSRLGVASAKFASCAAFDQYVCAYGLGCRTHAALKECSLFGMVQYLGSTQPGWSGAPYYMNNTIYGLHVGGGASGNYGYVADFIHAITKSYSEESPDYIMRTARRRKIKKLTIRKSPGNPDDWIVTMDGRYHVVDDDDLAKMEEQGLTFDIVGEKATVQTELTFLADSHPSEFASMSLPPQNLKEMAQNHRQVTDLKLAPAGEAQYSCQDETHLVISPETKPTMIPTRTQTDELTPIVQKLDSVLKLVEKSEPQPPKIEETVRTFEKSFENKISALTDNLEKILEKSAANAYKCQKAGADLDQCVAQRNDAQCNLLAESVSQLVIKNLGTHFQRSMPALQNEALATTSRNFNPRKPDSQHQQKRKTNHQIIQEQVASLTQKIESLTHSLAASTAGHTQIVPEGNAAMGDQPNGKA